MNNQTNDQTFRRFQGATHTYADAGILGGGQTATVYRVRQEDTGDEFALKLLKSGEYHTRFFREVDTLQLLARYADDLRNSDGRLLVPRIIEYKNSGEDQFIVMTLAFGTALDEVQRERGRLSEKAALSILSKTAQLFHILHTKLHRSYLDFQPRNIYWEEKSDALLIIDWNLLSPPNQADAPADIAALGTLLYRLVVGVQPPAYGFSSGLEWDSETPGTQAILRKAIHDNPAFQYSSAQAFGSACAEQLRLWIEPIGDTVNRIADLEAQIRTHIPSLKTEQFTPEEAREKLTPEFFAWIQNMRNDLAVVAERETELDKQRKFIYENIRNDNGLRVLLEKYGTALNQGLSFLSVPDREAAAERFREALQQTSDPQAKLTASRWLLVSEIVQERARDVAQQACQALAAGNPQKALVLLSEQIATDGKESAQVLRGELQAIRLWQEVENLQANPGRIVGPQRLRNALEKLQEMQAILDRLTSIKPVHGALLSQQWGDMAERIADLQERITKIENDESQIRTLRTKITGSTPAEVLDLFTQQFALFPRNAELISLALASAREQILNVLAHTQAEGIPEQLHPIEGLLRLAIAEGFDIVEKRKAMEAEWQVVHALKRMANILDTGFVDGPQIEKCFNEANTSASELTSEKAVDFMTRMLMDQAQREISPAKADMAVRLAHAYAPTLTQEMDSQKILVVNQFEKQVTERHEQEVLYWKNVEEEILRLRQRRSQLANDEAQALLKQVQKLVRDDDSERQLWITKKQDQLTADLYALLDEEDRQKQSQAIQKEFDQLQNRLRSAITAGEARNIRDELAALAQAASEKKLYDLTGEIQRIAQNAAAAANDLDSEERIVRQAQEQYMLYTNAPADDPDFRTARLAKLRNTYSLLSSLDEQENRFLSQKFKDLWTRVDGAWRTEGGGSDPANPDNPLLVKLDETSNRVENALLSKLEHTNNQVDKLLAASAQTEERSQVQVLPRWLTWISVATSLLILVLFFVPAAKYMTAPNTANVIQNAVTPIVGSVANLQTSVNNLATASQTGVDSTITNILNNIQAGVNDIAATLAEQTAGATSLPQEVVPASDSQGSVIPSALEQDIQNREAAVQAQEADLVATGTAIAATVTADGSNLRATAEAQNATATAFSQTQSQINIQSTTAARIMNQAQAQATALVGTVTAIARTASTQSAAPASTPIPTPTPTPSPIPIAYEGQFIITFPEEGARLYVAPWQIQVTAIEWLTITDQYRLLLNGVELRQVTIDYGSDLKPIIYERDFAGNALMDSFPGLDEDSEKALNLDINKQLPPSIPYILTFQGKNGSDWKDLATSTFFILSDGYVMAIENIQASMLRRLGPNPTATIDRGNALPAFEQSIVKLVGKTFGYYQPQSRERTYELLVLWEATVGEIRRGWAPASFFDIQGGKTVDNVPSIAPNQPR